MPQTFTNMSKVILLACLVLGMLFLGTGFLLLYPPSVEQKEISPPSRNVVLIVMDAFRADRIGQHCNGVALTPFLDSLSNEALVFTNAISACTWTRPAMASLYTSLHIDAHQVISGSSDTAADSRHDALSPELPTIATELQRVGYNTVCVQTNGNLFPEFGFNHGFDKYTTMLNATGAETTDKALEQLNNVASPFFLYVHYMGTHFPYSPPPAYRDLLNVSSAALPAEEQKIVEDFKEYFWDHCQYVTGQKEQPSFPSLSDAGKQVVREFYDALVRYTDDEISRLISHIRKAYPDTMFIVTADHGEHFWDHGYLGHGLTLYDVELRVPVYLFGAGIQPGVIDRPVELIDIAPTITTALGLPAPTLWQGNEMINGKEKPVFARTYSSAPSWNTDMEVVVASGMKLIVNNKTNTMMLFPWLNGNRETQDVSHEYPEEVARLRDLLKEHTRQNMLTRQGKGEQAVVDQETVQQLKNLGYME